jgi:chemotaxis protein methyltransferase CheR
MSQAAMRASAVADYSDADQLGERNYQRLAALVGKHSGIRLPPGKRLMLEGRLRKRVRFLGYGSLDDYCHYLFEANGLAEELTHLIDVVTTNKTDFFREPQHFDYLTQKIVPDILAKRSFGATQPHLKIWSAASSTGAEAYTIGMVLSDMMQRGAKFRFSILGTDISTDVLKQAVRAVYPQDMVSPVPYDFQMRYLMRSRNKGARQVRIVPELRRITQFLHLNLMDSSYPVDRDVDVIFLRNVLIYFEKQTQQAVLRRLAGHLRPGGHLILGHSESMIGTTLQMTQVAPGVFQNA